MMKLSFSLYEFIEEFNHQSAITSQMNIHNALPLSDGGSRFAGESIYLIESSRHSKQFYVKGCHI